MKKLLAGAAVAGAAVAAVVWWRRRHVSGPVGGDVDAGYADAQRQDPLVPSVWPSESTVSSAPAEPALEPTLFEGEGVPGTTVVEPPTAQAAPRTRKPRAKKVSADDAPTAETEQAAS